MILNIHQDIITTTDIKILRTNILRLRILSKEKNDLQILKHIFNNINKDNIFQNNS